MVVSDYYFVQISFAEGVKELRRSGRNERERERETDNKKLKLPEFKSLCGDGG